MKILRDRGLLSKKYLRRAAVYRRHAGRLSKYDFSMAALLACFHNESNGLKLPYNHRNGYVIGKHWYDLTITTIREDIINGDFCKVEFITPLTRWYMQPALATCLNGNFFPFCSAHNLSVKNQMLRT